MNNLPLVSVIIPYFNKRDTIKRSIQSVINQTYQNWELIIVDDKSSELFDCDIAWSDYDLKHLKNEVNLGAAKSRQVGQDSANGKYLAFLDADDWWGNNFLELCVKCLEENDDCSGCYANIIEVNNGVFKKRNQYSGLTKIRETVIAYYRPWQTSGILWKKNMAGTWGTLKTREDAWFEMKSSLNNNNLIYVEEENCFVGKDGFNHLSYLNGKTNSIIDQQKLFLMIYKEFRNKLNFKFQIILFHRLVLGQIKINRYCPEFKTKMMKEFYLLKPMLFWISGSNLILKIIHKILKYSIFKINL